MKTFLLDSISAIGTDMAGQIVVSGSHGGISAAHLALAHPPALAVFNDAGGGLDDAGIRGLVVLAGAGVAACAVSHRSARIGEAASTLATGIISAANSPAADAGIRVGQTCAEAISLYAKHASALGSKAKID